MLERYLYITVSLIFRGFPAYFICVHYYILWHLALLEYRSLIHNMVSRGLEFEYWISQFILKWFLPPGVHVQASWAIHPSHQTTYKTSDAYLRVSTCIDLSSLSHVSGNVEVIRVCLVARVSYLTSYKLSSAKLTTYNWIFVALCLVARVN
jgi:hypothetical protein